MKLIPWARNTTNSEREKDPEVFNTVSYSCYLSLIQKVKTEVDFALLRISEKRYKAEAETEKLKEVLTKKNQYIHDLEIKMRDMKRENDDLKSQVIMLEEENKELKANGGTLKKKDQTMKSLVPGAQNIDDDQLDVRDDLSELQGAPNTNQP
jgi:predicted  nucleic acid-binding Zn-ribbon protein